MRNPWTLIALLMIMVGLGVSLLVSSGAGGGSARFAATLGQVFGFPILLVLLVPLVKEHRNWKSVSKTFSLSAMLMTAVTLTG